jgi:hypothetical protein
MDVELTYIKNPEGGKTLTIPEEQRALAVRFLREGGRKSASEIEALVGEGHEALLRAIDGVEGSRAKRRPEPDEWSVLEVMDHVVTGKRLVAALCAGLAAGQLPPGFGASSNGSRAQDGVTLIRFETLQAARAAADEAQASLLNCIRSFEGETDDEMKFTHFVFGSLNCREWAVFQRLHDDNHLAQIRAAAAAAL